MRDGDPPREILWPRDGARRVLVPAGEFWMGSDLSDADASPGEMPRRRVCLDSFYIDLFPITNARYRRYLEETGRRPPEFWRVERLSGPDQPVVGVSWEAAAAYCAWAGKRLPTEAEWEKACRGEEGRRHPWGDAWDPARANTPEYWAGRPVRNRWEWLTRFFPKSFSARTTPEGTFPGGASPWGCQDMIGNVLEWTADWYSPRSYRSAPDRNPRGPERGKLRAVRGGSWSDFIGKGRCASRYGWDPRRRGDDLGFRCAVGAEELAEVLPGGPFSDAGGRDPSRSLP